jgi:hypothetical protein
MTDQEKQLVMALVRAYKDGDATYDEVIATINEARFSWVSVETKLELVEELNHTEVNP